MNYSCTTEMSLDKLGEFKFVIECDLKLIICNIEMNLLDIILLWLYMCWKLQYTNNELCNST